MPINRAPFNALVDDDGSNSVGTPWNKAAIAGVLLDPIDAMGAGVDVPFVATNFPNLTLTAGQVQMNRYAVVGGVLFWSLYVAGASVPTQTPNLALVIPVVVHGAPQLAAATAAAAGGNAPAILATQAPGTIANLQRIDGAPFPVNAGGTYFYFNVFLMLP